MDLERAVLPPETVFTSRTGDAILIRIAAFASDTDERFSRDIERQLAKPGGTSFKGLVIDLRGNRGGLLRQAVAATEVLMDGVVATTSGRNKQAEHEWRAGPGDLVKDKPIVVLVDGRSASAAEIMAGALEDQGRAVVVGSSTLGKGLVQTITTLPDGGELFVSWSRVLAPSGWPIQGLGVMPQVCTSLSEQRLAEQLASLEKGALLDGGGAGAAPGRPRPAAAGGDRGAARGVPGGRGPGSRPTTARWLLAHPAAYDAALLSPPLTRRAGCAFCALERRPPIGPAPLSVFEVRPWPRRTPSRSSSCPLRTPATSM